MIAFQLLTINVQIIVYIVSLCVSLFLLGIIVLPVYGKRKGIRQCCKDILFLVSFLQTLSFYYYRQGMTGFHRETALSDWIGNIPLFVHFLVFGIAVIYGGYELSYFRREQKTQISNHSIKYGIDTLSGGLLFARDNGRILLRNHRMDQLAVQLLGKELTNANELWKKVESLSGQIYHIAGQNFNFERKEISWRNGNVQRITANDLTRLQTLHQELEDRKTQLQDMNSRLREYSKDVLETTAAKERLQTKMRIHDEFGQALIKTKVYLTRLQDNQKDEELLEEIIDRWMRTIQVLERGATKPDEKQGMTYVTQMAQAVNVKLELGQEIPEDERLQSILPSVLIEAITNAIKHGNAMQIWLSIKDEVGSYVVSIANDGITEGKEVEPSGGLKSLQTVLKDIGGNLSVHPVPRFTLQITVPKEGGRL